MKKIRLIVVLMLTLCSLSMSAQENPLWMRYSAISPDGSTIAFCYQGDIYTVPAGGGEAIQLTSNDAYDYMPVWSPDGKTIAFASNRYGSFDIFKMPALGGTPVRLTYWSGKETPITFSSDGKKIYVASQIMPDIKFSMFPRQTEQIYTINVDGGRLNMFSPAVMESMSISSDGSNMLYHNKKGYEDPWRKHHTSSIARDICLYDVSKKRHSIITDYAGEDRNPVFVPGSSTEYYFLSERSGSFNIWKGNINGGEYKQITNFDTHPVRFLSISNSGLMAFSYDGELYTVRDGEEPLRVAVTIRNDKSEPEYMVQTRTNGAGYVAVSPDGKEVAFIIRGDVYVASAEYGTTVRITNTPEQERNVDFSPDGRSIVYSAERDGCWNIYMSEIVDKEDKMFTYAKRIKETQLTEGNVARFQPRFSPDGKEVAFLENRTTLRVINIKTKNIRTVLDGKYNYSYSDGDQYYSWSPDGEWIAVNYFEKGGWINGDIAMVKADGKGEIHNLTESGYSYGIVNWAMGGNALIVSSDRYGYRSHGSWGAEVDLSIIFFNKESYDKFKMDNEEAALYAEKNSTSKSKKDDKKDSTKISLPKIEYDFDNVYDRTVRLTPVSASYLDAYLSSDASKLYYIARYELNYELWMRDIRKGDTRMISRLGQGGGFCTSHDGKHIFLASGGGINKIDLNSGKLTPVNFAAEFNYRPSLEREYIFNHAWQQVVDKFYDPNIHGIDWDGYKKAYARFLPHINNNYDFAEMLSEMLGELNASHTGCRYYDYGAERGDMTADLGMFFDNNYDGDGLRILEVLENNPMIPVDSKIKPGVIIEKIDGNEIKKDEDYYRYLNHKVGKNVVFSLKDGGKRWEETLKPISTNTVSEMLYERWVKQREALVDSLSNGRIGYVHVRGMDSQSFREVFSKALGKYRNCEALIVDTRFNGGGWLHDDLATFLNGERYADLMPRGQYIASEPLNKWYKPSCIIVGEGNYSDAHGFPFSYKSLNIGKIIGMPVPGTMTAVWWETQIDPTLVFGIPQVGFCDTDGKYQENNQLEPDILVNNTTDSMIEGRDLQIEAAVKAMLDEVNKK